MTNKILGAIFGTKGGAQGIGGVPGTIINATKNKAAMV
jgi:hypothetical protein